MKTNSFALLVSTYNSAKTLELILWSLTKQSVLPDEILIADDGSSDATADVIRKFKPLLKTTIIHQWHEDNGFRKSAIINKTVAKSSADYVIQVDGDCILHPKFIEDHIKNSKPNLYLYGTRVHIKEKFVKKVIDKKIIQFSFFNLMLKKRFRNLRLPILSNLFKIQTEISSKFRGCNTSFWRKDFIAINGYNEDFEGWGREDSELMIRLHNNGIQGKRLKFCGIVYHLDHQEKDRSNFKANNRIQKETIDKKLTYIDNGINKYL